MTTIIMAAVLQASAATIPEKKPVTESTYNAAWHRSMDSGRPLVVLLGADWCPACVQLKKSVIPRVAKAGALDGVEFAYVDVDRQPELAGRLAQANAIPQMIRFEKTEEGWRRDLLTGAHSVKKVTSFVEGSPKEDEPAGGLSAAMLRWAVSIAAMK